LTSGTTPALPITVPTHVFVVIGFEDLDTDSNNVVDHAELFIYNVWGTTQTIVVDLLDSEHQLPMMFAAIRPF
jgi:hypothetical protein